MSQTILLTNHQVKQLEQFEQLLEEDLTSAIFYMDDSNNALYDDFYQILLFIKSVLGRES